MRRIITPIILVAALVCSSGATMMPDTASKPTPTTDHWQMLCDARLAEFDIGVEQTGTSEENSSEVATEPPYELYFDEDDVVAVAQMLWGEARGCTYDDKRNCIITVCNRCDDSRWPNTPIEVVSQYYQYLGYSPYNPVDEELYALALEVLTDWSLMKQGVECEWYGYNSFYGDGVRNHFYEV